MHFLNGFLKWISVLKLEESTFKRCERHCFDVSILSNSFVDSTNRFVGETKHLLWQQKILLVLYQQSEWLMQPFCLRVDSRTFCTYKCRLRTFQLWNQWHDFEIFGQLQNQSTWVNPWNLISLQNTVLAWCFFSEFSKIAQKGCLLFIQFSFIICKTLNIYYGCN